MEAAGSPLERGYVRFGVTGLVGVVSRATLRLYATAGSSVGFSVRGVTDNTWGETTITYNNAPAPSPTSTASSGSIATGWISLDVTPLVRGNGAVSFALTSTATKAVVLATREKSAALAPQLVVEVTLPDSAPANTSPPTISGTAQANQTLTSDPGTWSGTQPIGYAYQWRRCDAAGSVCSDIAGATAQTYGLTTADVGSTMRVAVTASNGSGSSSSSSAQTALVAALSSGGTAPFFRYAYLSASDPAANKALGATMIDVGSKSSADALPAGLQGMVWVGDYDNTTCSWETSDAALSSTVTAALGDPKVYGFFTSDEPNPLACPTAPAQHKARSDLIHGLDPTTKTFIVLDSNGFSGNLTQDAIDQIPLWLGSADLIGLDPYPCLVGKACDYSFLSNMIAKADAAGIAYVGVLQAFDGTGAGEQFRLPTTSELQAMVNLWAASHELGSGYFAWAWPPGNWALNAHPGLESVIQSFYTGSSSIDTNAPSAPGALTKSAASTSSVSLSWTASSDNVGVTGYNVYQGSTLVGNTSSTSYTVGSLACGTGYTFGVEARDAAGNVSTQTTLTASTSACPVTAPPVNTALPVISGSTSVTGVLTASTGTWSNSPTGYAYKWQRCDAAGSACSDVPGATAQTYGLTAADVGSTMRVAVTASSSGGASTALSAQTAVVSAASDSIVIAAAGDICSSSVGDCAATANLLDSINPTAVLTLGDNAYEDGALSQYNLEYKPYWGRQDAKVYPSPGNHDFHTANGQGYLDYFGVRAPALWYSYDLGTWHVISLAGDVGVSASAGSPQETFLKNDLAAHPAQCILAYWHEPRFSSGTVHGSDSGVSALWKDLYAAHGDLILNGHEHNYERFAKQDPNGVADRNGIREIVAGTGGAHEGVYPFGTPVANSEVRNQGTSGVLKVMLHPGSYDWQFVPVAGASFTDAGSDVCGT